MDDTYLTISRTSEGIYKEKMSKFLAFAIPVSSVEDVKKQLEKYQKEYYDARHVCWAYMLGPQRTDFRSNDNGEPSGTAGKPILGQINSAGLTDILIVVVRYFGGIKLGTSGLIVAYREAASEAIAANEIIERQVEDEVHFGFEYPLMNEVMRIVKEEGPTIVSQIFDMDCPQVLLDDLELSYAITIHKSMGSEYDTVIIPLLAAHNVLLTRNLLYTAITRAKRRVLLVGEKRALYMAIHRSRKGKRNTMLGERIALYYKAVTLKALRNEEGEEWQRAS